MLVALANFLNPFVAYHVHNNTKMSDTMIHMREAIATVCKQSEQSVLSIMKEWDKHLED